VWVLPVPFVKYRERWVRSAEGSRHRRERDEPALPGDRVHASSLLRPRGVVVASIPNVRHVSVTFPLLARGLWEYQDEGLLDQTHLRFFTRRSMETLFRSSGYEVERIEAINLSDGKTGAILRLGGRWAEEFRAFQYVVVAHPK